MRLSDEQNAVVKSDIQKFTVRAAAGSGKTSVLVDRYLRHVLELGYSPEEIVTLTFTRKAAAEMKQRIVNRLREHGDLKSAQVAETGPIQTIHSFCERVLRENAVEAEVDPEFEILQGQQASALVDEALMKAALAARDEHPHAAELVHILAGRGAFGEGVAPHGKLRKVIGELLDKFRASGWSPLELSTQYATPESTLEFWASQALRDFPEDVTVDKPPGTDGWGQLVMDKVKLRTGRAPGWLRNQSPRTDRESAEDTCGLVWLVIYAWQSLEAAMVDRQQFDFALLEAKAVRLLEHSEVTRRRLRQKARLVLVDEAQDLNPVQYRIIDRLDACSEMMVGDPRQSIYGFRFADLQLFVDRCDQVFSYDLSINYRSQPGILDFVDAVFSQVPGFQHQRMVAPQIVGDDPFGEDSPSHFEGIELWPLTGHDTASMALLVHQLIQEGTALKDIAILTRGNATINLLADRLKLLGVPVKTIGSSEKFFTRLEVRDLANALEALADPRGDFALLALLHSPFVGLTLDAVMYLASQQPVCEALERPGPWSPDDQDKLVAFRLWYDQAKATVDRVPAWETLALLFSSTPYLESLARSRNARQSLANVRKLFAMAAAEPELNAREFALRLREIQFLKHKEGDAPLVDENEAAVTLMTIHKAKGLEFEVVVLPDTNRKFDGPRGQVETDVTQGLVVTGLRKSNTAFYQWLRKREMEKDRAEEMRVLYVAMTRAKKRLCLVTTEEGGDDRPANIIAKRAGLPKAVLPGIKVRRLNVP